MHGKTTHQIPGKCILIEVFKCFRSISKEALFWKGLVIFFFKTPDQLCSQSNFSMSDFDLYVISMVLSRPNNNTSRREAFWNIWNQDNRKYFGILLPESGENIATVRWDESKHFHLITIILCYLTVIWCLTIWIPWYNKLW